MGVGRHERGPKSLLEIPTQQAWNSQQPDGEDAVLRVRPKPDLSFFHVPHP